MNPIWIMCCIKCLYSNDNECRVVAIPAKPAQTVKQCACCKTGCGIMRMSPELCDVNLPNGVIHIIHIWLALQVAFFELITTMLAEAFATKANNISDHLTNYLSSQLVSVS